MHPLTSDCAAAVALALFCAGAHAQTAALDVSKLPPPALRRVDFVTDVKPLLTRACTKCHGEEKQKGGYRLDQKALALTGGDNHAPNILPGKSAESPLIHFVAGLDPEIKMPAKGDPLTAGEIGLLRAWIDQGAVWSENEVTAKRDPLDWWSLRPLERAAVPRLSGEPANPVDAFIRAKLAEEGLAPSAEADPRTLIRRIHFDLIGLPPTAEETDAFVAEYTAASVQQRQSQIESLADRLLASPRYGERWARHWLDVVHYGDTHGYDKDKPRPNAWPYRDYVIRAFNVDKPYARFVLEQIAGDALFSESEDGITALGFIAAGPWDFIGHAELPESKIDGMIARSLDRDDMVANTLNTFCALTIQCARCHDHKFDPVKQEDYYRLQAVFAALDRTDKTYDLDPAVGRRRSELEASKRSLEDRKNQLQTAINTAGGRKLALLDKLLEEMRRANEAVERPEFGWHSAIEKNQSEAKWVQIDLGASVSIATIVYAACNDNFANIGAGFGFPLRFKVEVANDPSFASGVTRLEGEPVTDVPNPGVTPRRIDVSSKTARYVRFTATKLAPRLNDFIFALAEIQVLDGSGRNIALGATVTSLDSIEAPPRWGRQNLVDGYYYGHKAEASSARIAALQAERESLIAKAIVPASAERSSAPSAIRGDAVREDISVPDALREVETSLAGIDVELKKLPPPKTIYAGAVHHGTGNFSGTGPDGGKPRKIFLLKRGDVRQPAQEVGPGTVPLIPGLPSQFELPDQHPESARRVALARWITDRRNPLTWRVIVNRVWQYHFGRGLADSPNDFGRMGQRPSHPELLDWLASEFRDGDQSLKKLHRLIVTSATYRQSSSSRSECEKADADNRMLWRMNRRKLEAEAVRDSVLAVAGTLDLTMGGPGFQDFVIEKAEHSPHYEYRLHNAEDPQTRRRSIYRFIVRSQPEPFMSVLDCADPSISVDKRNETLNPLQALALRNNKLIIAMSKHFAARVAGIANDPEQQIAAAFRFALSRSPDVEESKALSTFAREHGLANACRVILNLNEFAFVD